MPHQLFTPFIKCRRRQNAKSKINHNPTN